MSEEEKIRQAILRGAQHMVDQGLGDWTLKLSNRRAALADCNNRRKTIRYSKHFLVIADENQFDGVTFHEIAHALLPAGVGHGPSFVKKCKEISPVEGYAKRGVELGIGKYKMTCPNCGVTGTSNKTRISFCKSCHENGVVSRFVFEKNKLRVTVW